MAARQPVNVEGTHYGTEWLRIRWQDEYFIGTTAPDGFKVWYDDTSVTVPTWTVPPAIDNELNGSNGETPVMTYTVIIHTPTGTACYWETFEEYPLGAVNSMSLGGQIWQGGWSSGGVVYGWAGRGDDFESYTLGQTSGTFAGGTGWQSDWYYGL